MNVYRVTQAYFYDLPRLDAVLSMRNIAVAVTAKFAGLMELRYSNRGTTKDKINTDKVQSKLIGVDCSAEKEFSHMP